MVRVFLSVFSVSYNPILYVLYNDQFKNGFRQLWSGWKQPTRILPSSIVESPNIIRYWYSLHTSLLCHIHIKKILFSTAIVNTCNCFSSWCMTYIFISDIIASLYHYVCKDSFNVWYCCYILNFVHFEISGYTLFYIDGVKKQGGGVAVNVSSKFNCHIVDLIFYEHVLFIICHYCIN